MHPLHHGAVVDPADEVAKFPMGAYQAPGEPQASVLFHSLPTLRTIYCQIWVAKSRVYLPPASCRTVAINNEGVLVYNREFVEKNIASREDLFSLLFHETLHEAEKLPDRDSDLARVIANNRVARLVEERVTKESIFSAPHSRENFFGRSSPRRV